MDVLIGTHVQQILVARHDGIGLDGQGGGNDVIVVRIAARAANVRSSSRMIGEKCRA